LGADVRAGRVLWRALSIVKEREAAYGPPAEHWGRTAAILTAAFAHKLKPDAAFTAEDWGLVMVLEKVSRRLGPDGGLDQLVDIAGYADGIGRLEEATDGDQEPEAEGSVA
jgi:hypothetical protein